MSRVRDTYAFVHDISDAIDDIVKYRQDVKTIEELESDTKTFDAIVRKLEIIGEAVNNLSKEFLQKHNQIDWRGPVGLRNVISHEYFEVSGKVIWNLIDRDLPVLKSQIAEILQDEGK